MKRQFDKKVNPNSLKKYEIGNQVLILNHTQKKGKLENRWLGPFSVVKVNISTVLIDKNGKHLRCKNTKVSSYFITILLQQLQRLMAYNSIQLLYNFRILAPLII